MKISILTNRSVLSACAAALLCGALTACVPLIVGGAMGGSALVATDRRTSGTQLEDEGIELRAANRLRNQIGDRGHVNLTSYGRQVLITGEAASEEDKRRIEQVVSGVENVSSVVNEVAVMGNSSLAQRSSDTLITGRVKAALIDAQDLQINAFKVTTERGVSYLMGRVSQREADRLTQIVRSTPGVLKVIRLFDVISEAELARLPSAPPPKQ